MIIEIIAQYVALLWVVTMGPWNFSVLIRAMMYDRNYIYSLTDTMTGASIFVLLVAGLPPLGI